MKKLLIALVSVLTLTGCGCANMSSTPTARVEEYLNKYQTLDNDVLDQLESVLDMDDLNDDNKKSYEDLIKRQYQDLEYTVKDETIDGDEATVEVEIEVYDYQTIINESDTYLSEHEDEFYKDDEDVLDNDKYMAYKVDKLKDVKDKTKYTIYFTLTKDEDGKWKLNDLSETDRLKLHGLYTDTTTNTTNDNTIDNGNVTNDTSTGTETKEIDE